MQVHPNLPHLFATGGEEQDLCIWDVTKYDESHPSNFKPIWEARNVPHDYLDLRVPIWINDLVWDIKAEAKEHYQLITVTGHHQVRIYNTSQRKPLSSVAFGEHPLKKICLDSNSKCIGIADNTGGLTKLDPLSGKVECRFKGIPGAVSQSYFCSKKPLLVTVGIDRHLRVFEGIEKGRLIQSVISNLHRRILSKDSLVY